jgi:hypothetical protein
MIMSVKLLLHRLELNFWDSFIPLMHKSPPVRFLVPRIYRWLHTKEVQQTAKLVMVLTVLGFIIGFVLGSLSQI